MAQGDADNALYMFDVQTYGMLYKFVHDRGVQLEEPEEEQGSTCGTKPITHTHHEVMLELTRPDVTETDCTETGPSLCLAVWSDENKILWSVELSRDRTRYEEPLPPWGFNVLSGVKKYTGKKPDLTFHSGFKEASGSISEVDALENIKRILDFYLSL